MKYPAKGLVRSRKSLTNGSHYAKYSVAFLMTIIKGFLLFVCFCILSGFLEAYCWHSLFSEELGFKFKDEHTKESLYLFSL